MSDPFRDMIMFHKAIDAVVKPMPVAPDPSTQNLRITLVKEETKELIDALETFGNLECSYIHYKDMKREERLVFHEIADGAIDAIVVILGTLVSYGIDFRPIWDEIMRTNFAKASGPVREDGKRLKPKGWVGPDIENLLLTQKKIS